MASDVDIRGPAPARSPWRRAAVLAAIALLPLGWLVGWLVGSPIAARLCAAEIERHFAAQVEIGALHYWPPYWVVARDVVVTSDLDGERVDWITLPALRASLAWLPFRAGSIDLVEVALQDPSVTVVRTATGVRDVLDLWRDDQTPTPADLPVQRVRVAGARVAYLDRSPATPRAAPFGVGGFTVQLDAAGGGRRTFNYDAHGGDAVLGLESSGTLDLGQRTLDVARLDARVRIETADVEVRGATAALDLGQRTARVTGGTIAFAGPPPLLLEDVRGSLTLTVGRLDASELAARVAGGNVSGVFAVRWDDAPGWQLEGRATELDLKQLAAGIPALGGERAQGRLSGSGSFSGDPATTVTALLDSLRGQGRARAHDGHFYEVPLVAKLLQAANLDRESATLSDAAAVFRLADRTIHFDNAAIGSSTVGVQGNGTIGFDGRLALEMAVVPLGDWRARLGRARLPVLGDTLASLAGKVQSLFDDASAALYQFHVSGTMQEPRLTPVPVPVLTRSAAAVFGHLATKGWQGDVLGETAAR